MGIFDAFIPGIYVLAPGLIVTGIGIISLVRRWLFLRRGFRTHGTVLSLEERYPFGLTTSRGAKAVPCFLPRIQFLTENGQRHEFVEQSASRFLSPQVGGQIPLVYDPQNPRCAHVDHWMTLWSQHVVLTALGVALLALGLGFLSLL